MRIGKKWTLAGVVQNSGICQNWYTFKERRSYCLVGRCIGKLGSLRKWTFKETRYESLDKS